MAARGLSSHAPGGVELAVDAPIKYERQGRAHVVELHRPRALNALSWEMVDIMRRIYTGIEQQAVAGAPTGDVVVLRGSGHKAFCAGGDVVQITTAPPEAQTVHFFRDKYQLDYGIATLRTPHVSLIDGITMGGGCGVAINGAYRVATERTMLAMPEAGIGFFCDVGGSHFLPRLNPAYPGLAAFLGLTAGRLQGGDVYHAGFATHFVPSAALPDLVTALQGLDVSGTASTRGTAAWTAAAHQAVQQTLARFHQTPPPLTLTPLLPVLRDCFQTASLETTLAQLEKVANGNNEGTAAQWAASARQKMQAHSPTSLRIIWEQLHQGATWDLREALRREYNIAQAYMSLRLTADFKEGVRAVLIDKDNRPAWRPADLREATPAYAMKFLDFEQETLALHRLVE
jgi:enoyl-CoA hydratase/carnithine racemase